MIKKLFIIFWLIFGLLTIFIVVIKKSLRPVMPLTIDMIPTLSPDQGQGIDLNSKPIQNSLAEIKKIAPHLPYQKKMTLSTGLETEILLPEAELLDNPWTLKVQIFGIDYQAASDDKNYDLMKKSFQEAAENVFLWLKGYQVNPAKILISWGDRVFIQETAEKWLKEL